MVVGHFQSLKIKKCTSVFCQFLVQFCSIPLPQVILGIIDSEAVVKNAVTFDVTEYEEYYYYTNENERSLLGDTMWVAAVVRFPVLLELVEKVLQI